MKSGASGRCPAAYSTAFVLPSRQVTPLLPPLAHPAGSTTASSAPVHTAATKTTARRLPLNTGGSLRSPTGGSTALLCRIILGHLTSGRHRVRYADDPVTRIGKAGHAAERALARRRVVPQRASLGVPAGHPDGQLVAHAHRPLAGPPGRGPPPP